VSGVASVLVVELNWKLGLVILRIVTEENNPDVLMYLAYSISRVFNAAQKLGATSFTFAPSRFGIH